MQTAPSLPAAAPATAAAATYIETVHIKLEIGQEQQVNRGPGDDLELGLRWDFFDNLPPVDLDAQAVMFDFLGNVVDAAFFNQLSACGGAVTHSGDNKTGHGEGDDETIRIDVDALPANVNNIAFVVTAHGGGNFTSVETANATLRGLQNDGNSVPLVDISVGCHGNHTALVLCILHKRDDGTWIVKDTSVPAMGKHFQECMPQIRAEVDKFIDKGLLSERVLTTDATFDMRKDECAAFPEGCQGAIIGLGWSCPGSIDLDASVVCLGSDKNVVHTISYSNLRGAGISHSGDNTTGAGSGDDEKIRIDFNAVPANVVECFVTVNIFSDGYSFSAVHDAYVRLCTLGGRSFYTPGHELARYKLDAGVTTRGLIFARLFRGHGGSWHLQALGRGCGGKAAVNIPHTELAQPCSPTASAAPAGYVPDPAPEPTADQCCIIL